MRQQKRAVTNREELLDILRRCDVCRVAFQTGGAPYIVPLSYGFRWEEDGLRLFFHCALEGRKLTLLRQSPAVGFELDTSHRLRTGPLACDWSMNYESLIGTGVLSELTDPEQKLNGLRELMRHYGGEGLPFSPAVVARTAVLRLDVRELCGKRLNK